MEWNGKSLRRDGAPRGRASAAITWGGVGTDAQHAVFQLLHHGTHRTPVEFVVAREPDHLLDDTHHETLVANCIAQGAALMTGCVIADGARDYPGDRTARPEEHKSEIQSLMSNLYAVFCLQKKTNAQWMQ